MPKVTCPLFSVGATGSVAKLLTYRKSPRGYICRKWSQPTGLPSADQLEVREFTGERMSHWPLISTEDQTSWLLLALERNVEPINVYLEENWKRKLRGLGTTDVWPAVEGEGPGDITISAGEPGPSPDCTGEYLEDGIFDEEMSYKRSPDGDYYLFWDAVYLLWIIGEEKLEELETGAIWILENKEGEYGPYGDCVGIAVVVVN
jgi:hypothetical protein